MKGTAPPQSYASQNVPVLKESLYGCHDPASSPVYDDDMVAFFDSVVDQGCLAVHPRSTGWVKVMARQMRRIGISGGNQICKSVKSETAVIFMNQPTCLRRPYRYGNRPPTEMYHQDVTGKYIFVKLRL